jgi:general secretion pathway protein B
MSFILDALKKSETDRQRQSSPALFEVKVAAPRRRIPLWVAGVAVLLGVNVLVLLWVLLRQPAAPAAQAAPQPVASAPAVPAAPSPNQSGMVTLPATVTFNAAPTVAVSANTAATNNPEPGVVGPSNAPPLAEEPQLSAHETAVPPDYDAGDYRPALSPDQARSIAAMRRAGDVPSRDERVADGDAIPELRLDLHVYDADPAKRFVFINMRKLREGDSLPDGVRVDQITPTGARLTYRGKEFSLGGN